MPSSWAADREPSSDQTYREHRPVATLDGRIVVWVQRISQHGPVYQQRTTPTGCVDLVCRPGTMPVVVGLKHPVTTTSVDVGV